MRAARELEALLPVPLGRPRDGFTVRVLAELRESDRSLAPADLRAPWWQAALEDRWVAAGATLLACVPLFRLLGDPLAATAGAVLTTAAQIPGALGSWPVAVALLPAFAALNLLLLRVARNFSLAH